MSDELDEPDANGRVLLRPNVPFRTRRSALQQMAAVVLDSPSVERPTSELRWEAEPPGQDVWQAPDETERLGTGDCEDLEMYAARQDLDAGVPDVQLCMSVGPRKNEHVFGMRGGVVVDHSEAAGMHPLSPTVYERRVCVPVRGEEGGRAMSMEAEIETGGPSEVFNDFNIHGTGHWTNAAWDRAAAMASQRYPRGRGMYMSAVPGLKSAAAYFSRLHLDAWDRAGNEAREQRVVDEVWHTKRTEDILRAAYRHGGGDDAGFVLDFERRYGRPPTSRASVSAAIRALIMIATAKEHPGYRRRVSELMLLPPRSLAHAALQVAQFAQGLVAPDAYPVAPHCPECAARRNTAPARVVEPEDITLNVVYNTSNTTTNAIGAGAVATTNTTTQANAPSGGSTVSAPVAAPAPVVAAPMVAGMPAPVVVQPPPPRVAVQPVVAAPAVAPPTVFGAFGPMVDLNPFGVGAFPPVVPAAAEAPPRFTSHSPGGSVLDFGMGGGPTSVSNAGNVNVLMIGQHDDEDGNSGGDETSGSDDTDGENAADTLRGTIFGAMGLTTGGPGDEELTTGGDEELTTGGDDELTTGGDDELTTGGDDELTTGGDDELTTGGDDEEGTAIDLFAPVEEEETGSLFHEGTSQDAESFVDVGEDCESGTCGLF